MKPTSPFEQAIALLTRQFAESEAQALQESELSELSMKQIVYLETIAEMEKPTPSDLAKALKVSKPSITAIIARLVEKGYVHKAFSESDRRSFRVLLTEKGHALSDMHRNLHRKIATHFASVLDESELQLLARLISKVINSSPK